MIYLYFLIVLDKFKIQIKSEMSLCDQTGKKNLKHPELVESKWKRTFSNILDGSENCYRFLESYLIY